jgi:hypothetical protein
MIEVRPVCLKFLQTILDKKKLKEIRLAEQGQSCESIYHKKLIG